MEPDQSAGQERAAAWPGCSRRAVAVASAVLSLVVLGGCASGPQAGDGTPRAHLPLQRAWFEGRTVLYVTTDASDPAVAKAKHANYAPLLANALADATPGPSGTRRPGATDRVYAFTNHAQANVFASAPRPVGATNRDTAYSPLWQMVKVTWKDARQAQELRSEEAVLSAAERGLLTLDVTRVVINCPVIHDGQQTGLPGVTVDGFAR